MSIIITIFLSLFFQIGFIPGLFPNVKSPEFFIPMIIVVSLLFGRAKGVTLAAFSGLLLDIYFKRAFGLRSLLFIAIAYIIGTFRDSFAKKSMFTTAILTILVGLSYMIFYRLGISFIGEHAKKMSLVDSIFSFEIIIQVLLSFIYFKVFSGSSKRKVIY